MRTARRIAAAIPAALLTTALLGAQEGDRLRVGDTRWEELSADDPELAGHGPSRTFELVADADGRLTVDLGSFDFDAFLVVEEEGGELFEFDDDGGIETDARVVFTAAAGTRYRVVAAQKRGRGGGRFRLSVERGDPPALSESERVDARVLHLAGTADGAAARGDLVREAELRLSIGELQLGRGRHEAAEVELERARELYRRIGAAHAGEPEWQSFAPWWEAECLRFLGGVASATGRMDAALARFTAAQALFGALAEPDAATRFRLALLDVNVGQVRSFRGESAEAQRLFERALPVLAADGDVGSQVWALGLLADVLRQSGRLEEAGRRIEALTALLRSEQDPDPRVLCTALSQAGGLLFTQDRWEEARARFEEWVTLAEEHDLVDQLSDAYSNLSMACERLGLPEARTFAERGRALAARSGDPPARVRALLQFSRTMGGPDPVNAILAAETALELALAVGDATGELEALGELATRHRQRAEGGPQAERGREAAIAGDYGQRGLERAQALGQRRAEAFASHELGNILRARGSVERTSGDRDAATETWRQALALYDRAEPLYAELGEATHWVRHARALTLMRLGRGEEATAILEELSREAIPREVRRLVVRDLVTLWAATDPLRAFELSQEHLILSHEVGPRQAASALVDLGDVNWSLGRPGSALSLYSRSLELRDLPKALWGLGLVRVTLGDHEGARALYLQALERLDHPILRANVGYCDWRLGELEAALAWCGEALAQAEEERDDYARADATASLAAIHADLGRWSEARRLADLAVRLDASVDLHPLVERLPHWVLARAALAEGDLPGAERAARAGEEHTRAARALVRAAGGWGSPLPHLDQDWERLMQDLAAARVAVAQGDERALLLAAGFRRASSAKGRQLLGGIVEHRRGERTAAVIGHRRELRAAVAEHLAVLMRLARSVGDDGRWRQTGELREEARRLQARVDSLRRTLDAMVRPDPDLPEGADPQEVRARLLDGRTALVEYAEGVEELYAFLLTPTGLQLLPLGDRETIGAQVDAFVQAVTERGGFEALTGAGRALGERLLAPVLDAAGPGIERLLVVPSSDLARLPFEALVLAVPEGARSFDAVEFVLDRYEVVLGPSSPVLLELAERGARRAGRVLLLADPVYPSEAAEESSESGSERAQDGPAFLQDRLALDPQDLQRLPKTREEALAIAGLLVGREEVEALQTLHDLGTERSGRLRSRWLDLHLGREATPERLGRSLADYKVLHLAAHGFVERRVLDRAVQEAGIVLTAGRDGDDGVLALSDVLELHLDADLVVLSACDSARRGAGPGEGVGSMALAFLYAGARSTVASLWQVDDAAAAETMKRFYAALFEEGLAPAAALRAAKRALREERGTRGVAPGGSEGGASAEAGHPFFWAPFVYLGLGE